MDGRRRGPPDLKEPVLQIPKGMWTCNNVFAMTDILIRELPDDVIAAVDANAQRAGVTRSEFLRRVLAEQQGPAVSRDHLDRLAERTADLGDPEVMAAAWRSRADSSPCRTSTKTST